MFKHTQALTRTHTHAHIICLKISYSLLQTLKLKTILKGDAPTSMITTGLLKREVYISIYIYLLILTYNGYILF